MVEETTDLSQVTDKLDHIMLYISSIYLALAGFELTTLYSGQGRIQNFKLGGVTLKKNCAERREARKFWGYFV